MIRSNARSRYYRFLKAKHDAFIDRNLSLADDSPGCVEAREMELQALMEEPFYDGCDEASAQLGVKSSCFECPFDECQRPGVLCTADDETLRCRGDQGNENLLRRSILDRVQEGLSVVCSGCGKPFKKGDSIYRLRHDLKARNLWCRLCFLIELEAFYLITYHLGEQIEKLRSYESIKE